ncbi:MAG: Sec-independent protein translocase subunit TatA [Nocardioidaceae bacterium]
MTGVVPQELLGLGPSEIVLIVIVVLLLFGAKRLPELARGSGRALRIFKAETKGLMDDDDDKLKTDAQLQLEEQQRVEAERRAATERDSGPDTSH